MMHTTLRDPSRRLTTLTAVAMAGLTAAFGWVLLLDLQLYGELPDPSLLPIQLLLVAATLVAGARRRWSATIAGAVALAAGIGSAVQPITMVRLTDPENLGFQLGTVLVLFFALTAVLLGAAATAQTIRARLGGLPGDT